MPRNAHDGQPWVVRHDRVGIAHGHCSAEGSPTELLDRWCAPWDGSCRKRNLTGMVRRTTSTRRSPAPGEIVFAQLGSSSPHLPSAQLP